ncbi:hypothetical protein PN498_00315 [Oscillatoria sp. CS-180]|uniref:hypothetical protein n=1 Tax=Oscillatoria sp. CS-180 TaxID=3021720 RepID=UPI00232EB7FA|nr:hypothetical protein [Oscillatoria sp. CS-180]MDB9524414.1 hypothetical protein [Oscillatoria sp. CS-180]
MTSAYALKGDHFIHYQLKQEVGYIKLRLWEPPGSSSGRQTSNLPYLYAANLTFGTLREAEAFLHDHLLTNGALDVPDTNFPQEGQIEILPYPTWGMSLT